MMIRTDFYCQDRLSGIYLTPELERAFAIVLHHMGHQVVFTTFPNGSVIAVSSIDPNLTATITKKEMPK